MTERAAEAAAGEAEAPREAAEPAPQAPVPEGAPQDSSSGETQAPPKVEEQTQAVPEKGPEKEIQGTGE